MDVNIEGPSYVNNGTSITLRCVIRSNLIVFEIYWFHNGTLLKMEDEVLKFTVKKSSAGSYNCLG